MDRTDHRRMSLVRAQADELLDAPKSTETQILNIDVLEALLGDIGHVQNGREPRELAELLIRAKEEGKS